MRVTPAPLLRSFADVDSWVKWFSQVSNALVGRWGIEWRNLELNNLSKPSQQILNYRGNEVSFLFYWNDGVAISDSSTISLQTTPPDGADPSLFPARLEIWEGHDLVGGAIVADRVISFPELGQLNGQVVVQGSAIIENKNPRGRE